MQIEMKSTFRFFVLLLAITGILVSGCEPVDSPDEGGDPRDVFVGEWQIVESGLLKSMKGQTYSITIAYDPANSSQVLLKNFGNSGNNNIYAKGVVTSKQIVVSSQKMSNGWTVEGNGMINNVAKTSMSWTISVTAGGDKETVSATATKQ